MSIPLRALIVEDSENDTLLIIDELRDGGYEPDYERVETREQMKAALRGREWDIIIADYRLPNFNGIEALEMVCERPEDCPFIIVSGQISEETAVSAMRAGAKDYVLKDNLARLVPAVERELREAEMRRLHREVEKALQAERERSHSILESITDGFYALDKDWRFTYVNAEAERLIGLDWQSAKGRSLWDVFPHLVGSSFQDVLNETMATRIPGTLEWFSERFQGWFLVRCYPYSDGIAVYVRDITDQKRSDEALRASEERLRLAQAVAHVGTFEWNIITGVNTWTPELEAMYGLEPGEFAGTQASWEELIHPDDRDEAVRRVSLALETGAFEGEWRVIWPDGTTRWIYGRGYIFKDESGSPLRLIGVSIDITERKAAEEAVAAERRRAESLERIAEAGISTTDMQELLDTLVLRMTEVLETHSCSIWILDEAADEFVARSARGVPGLIGARLRVDEGVAGIVYRDRQPLCVTDAENNSFVPDKLLKEQHVKSLISVPMISRDKVVGMARVDEIKPRMFTEEEVGIMEAMASRAAQAIDNIKLYDALTHSRNELAETLSREQHFSLLLQRALLPEKPSIDHSYSVAVEYIPFYMGREIGGDFYDVFKAKGGKAGVAIGDVSGKGLESASLAAETRSTIHTLAYETGSAGQALARANSILCSGKSAGFESKFVTVFLAVIDLETGEFCHASAGHPPAAICRNGGDVEFLQPNFMPPICVLPGAQYPEGRDRLAPGEVLVLFTDGIAEARRNSDMFDFEGIARSIREHRHGPVDEIAGELIAAASSWAQGHLSDDAAVVVVKREKPN